MNTLHRIVIALSCLIIIVELTLLWHFRVAITDWLSHNYWIVVIPFLKGIIKKVVVLKFFAFIKGLLVLSWHLGKLLLLKLLKTLSIRYGVFFSQNRWYWIRRSKVMFLRRGKQFFGATGRFWSHYSVGQKWLILVAILPIGLVLFLMGLSFNVTRKTMVKKTQESAIFQAATSAGKTNRGLRAWLRRLDERTLHKIREATPRAIVAKKESNDSENKV